MGADPTTYGKYNGVTELSLKSRQRLFAVGAGGTFMATFSASIVNVALPTIATDLDCSVDQAAWVVLAYSLALISLMLIFGVWTRSAGYAKAYKFGYVLFVVGSIICGLSGSIYALIFGRIVQGIGAALFAAVGPAMITDIFPPGERGRGIGWMVMTVALGFMIGPPLGGLLLSFSTWHIVFFVGVPIGLTGYVLAQLYFRDFHQSLSKRKLPLAAAGLMSGALVMVILSLSRVGEGSIYDIDIWLPFVIGLGLLIVFLMVESDPSRALIGLGIFRNRRFVVAVLAQQAHFISFSGVMLLMPFFLEKVKGLDPSEVGLYLVIIPISMFSFSSISGRVSDRIGYRWPTSAGMAFIAISLLMMALFDGESSSLTIILALLIMGTGVGVFSSPNSAALMESVTDEQRSVTSAILGTGRNIGIAVGVALFTALFDYFHSQSPVNMGETEAFLGGFTPVVWAALPVAIFGLLVCLTRKD